MKISERIKWFSKNGYKMIRIILIIQITITIIHVLFNNSFLIVALFRVPYWLMFAIHIVVIVLQFISMIGIIWYLIAQIIYKRRNENFKIMLICGAISAIIILVVLILDLNRFIQFPYAIIQYYLSIVNVVNIILLFYMLRKSQVNNQIFL